MNYEISYTIPYGKNKGKVWKVSILRLTRK